MTVMRLLNIELELMEVYLENEKAILNDEINMTQLAKDTGKDRKQLAKIRDMGYYKTNNGYLYDNQSLKEFLKIVEDYDTNKLGYRDVKAKYGLKRDTFISSYNKLYGREPSNYKKTSVVYDRHIFDDIDTEEKAYWLGFILADGNIFKGELRLKLGSIDRDHLVKYTKFVGCSEDMITSEIHSITGNTLNKVLLCGKEMIDMMGEKYKLLPAKTGHEIPYYEIRGDLRRHYIRGIFDGDGYIRKDLSEIGVCGSREVIEWIIDSISEDLKLPKTTTCNLQEPLKENLLYKTTFNKYKIEIAHYLYGGSTIHLDRKYKLYQSLMELKNK